MFWLLIAGLYIVTFPLNAFLLRNVWYSKYKPDLYAHLGETVSAQEIFYAQVRAIFLFGLIQPILASLPLIYGNEWYHYLICAAASIAYTSSGSANFYLDKVRSSHFLFISTLVVFGISAFIVKQVY